MTITYLGSKGESFGNMRLAQKRPDGMHHDFQDTIMESFYKEKGLGSLTPLASS